MGAQETLASASDYNDHDAMRAALRTVCSPRRRLVVSQEKWQTMKSQEREFLWKTMTSHERKAKLEVYYHKLPPQGLATQWARMGKNDSISCPKTNTVYTGKSSMNALNALIKFAKSVGEKRIAKIATALRAFVIAKNEAMCSGTRCALQQSILLYG